MGLQSDTELFTVQDLGRLSYALAYEAQLDAHRAVLAARDSGEAVAGRILLVEHDPPVITISRRPGVEQHLLADEAALRQAGVELAETDRGGDITYHGPGQLVAYPIVDLNAVGLNLHAYMRLLEQAAIDTCAAFGLATTRDAAATGVWVERDAGATPAKVCAIGVRIRRWVSLHGLALNVSTNLAHFDLIVPCGLHGRTVTSLERELGERRPSMDEVKRALISAFESNARRALAGRSGDAAASL